MSYWPNFDISWIPEFLSSTTPPVIVGSSGIRQELWLVVAANTVYEGSVTVVIHGDS